MRLLNIDTLELHEFFESNIPRYAILSHRWEDGEVTFKDVTKRRNLEAPGWQKIENFCNFVKEIYYESEEHLIGERQPTKKRVRLFNWVWVDTCSIDKRSSAELSEAINSMYKWYGNAAVCYVYLNDVSCPPDAARLHEDLVDIKKSKSGRISIENKHTSNVSSSVYEPADLKRSQWFTRGWTLQELIAPRHVLFVDRNWRLFGSKNRFNECLSNITGIDGVGNPRWNLYKNCVATKMSWAAKRICARPEDVAYSLLGVFKVNMPLLYGEGRQKAFERLQLEIIKQTDDESIFAWGLTTKRLREAERVYNLDDGSDGILASSPEDFSESWNLSTFTPTIPRLPYTMTNKGLQMTTVILPAADYATSKRLYIPLCCYVKGRKTPLAMRVIRSASGEYVRELGTFSDSLLEWPKTSDLEVHKHHMAKTVHISKAVLPEWLEVMASKNFGLMTRVRKGEEKAVLDVFNQHCA